MGIENNRMLKFIFGLFIVLSSCSQKKVCNERLCIRFIELNKGKNFDGLYDVAVGGRRVNCIYDESSNRYEIVFIVIDVYDYKSDEFFMLPLFKRDATMTEMDSAFNKVCQVAKIFLSEKYDISSETEIFDSYIDYVKMFYVKYDNIEVPKDLGSTNVLIEGHPRTGKFITFFLREECIVYYLADSSTLNEYWKKYFKKLNKLDDKWYFEVVKK